MIYLRAPWIIFDNIADSSFSAKVHFQVFSVLKNIFSSSRNFVLKIESCELRGESKWFRHEQTQREDPWVLNSARNRRAPEARSWYGGSLIPILSTLKNLRNCSSLFSRKVGFCDLAETSLPVGTRVPTGRDTTKFSSGGPYLENERYSFYEISHTVGIYHGGEPRKILARISAAKKQRGHPPCLGQASLPVGTSQPDHKTQLFSKIRRNSFLDF